MFNLENDREYKMTPKGALAAALVELFPMSTITELMPHAELVMRELRDWGFEVRSVPTNREYIDYSKYTNHLGALVELSGREFDRFVRENL